MISPGQPPTTCTAWAGLGAPGMQVRHVWERLGMQQPSHPATRLTLDCPLASSLEWLGLNRSAVAAAQAGR